MADKTSYIQCLTHMIKGNLGAGILAMPASFMHTGLVGGVLGLPFLCVISAYCVHLLLRSAEKISTKSKGQMFNHDQVNYAKLARGAFELGPERTRKFGDLVGRAVDTCLLVTQIGVCCVYIIFIVDNITSILASYRILVPKTMVFLAIFPVTLLLSFIRTLARLTVASLLANLLQAVGLALIVEYLLRDLGEIQLKDRDNFRPISEMALGFGSIMFAFEGISVVLPLYSRMRHPRLMSTCLGVVNVSFFVIVTLYFLMGLLGYLKFGHQARDSVTLNLPATPLYDAVRAMFTASILLSYPLQFYVPNEIIWNWAKKNLMMKPMRKRSKQTKEDGSSNNIKGSLVVLAPGTKVTETIDGLRVLPVKADGAESAAGVDVENSAPISSPTGDKLERNLTKFTESKQPTTANKIYNENLQTFKKASENDSEDNNDSNKVVEVAGEKVDINGAEEYEWPQSYEYYSRLMLVLLTFTLAITVPKLNLIMDLIGSFSGAALCLTIPATIHLAAFWADTKGFAKVALIIIDGFLIFGSIGAGLSGSLSSLVSIVRTFDH